MKPTEAQLRFSFLRRHSKWVSFAGALIVFITFIVKDTMREKLKDLVASLEGIQNLYTLRVDDADIIERLVKMESDINHIQFALDKHETRIPKATMDSENTYGAFLTLNIDTNIELERAEMLIKKLPRHESQEKELNELKQGLRDSQHLTHSIDPSVADLATSAYKKTVDEWYDQAMHLSGKVGNFIFLLEQHAERLTKEAEHTLNVYTIWSYVLYTLGWTLGLAGRLFGGGDMVAD